MSRPPRFTHAAALHLRASSVGLLAARHPPLSPASATPDGGDGMSLRNLWREQHLNVSGVTGTAMLDSLAAGNTVDEILAEYPQLTREDIVAAVEYAAVLAPEEFGTV